ncbi:MAG: hypothetical protein H0W18_18780 [Acidobacteria bacterium]|nr:hypothetical protein [Acidobacteriota bacterium]
MLWTILRAVLPGPRAWTPADDRSLRLSVISLDVQFLLGLLLYFVLSPFTREAMSDMGAAMRSPGLRFFAVEHVAGMLIAITLAHVGAVRIRKAAPERRHRLAAIFFILALLAVLASIPWPGLPAGRPLFRL